MWDVALSCKLQWTRVWLQCSFVLPVLVPCPWTVGYVGTLQIEEGDYPNIADGDMGYRDPKRCAHRALGIASNTVNCRLKRHGSTVRLLGLISDRGRPGQPRLDLPRRSSA